MNPFRPATLVVALSLAFAADLSLAADAAAAATAPVAAAPAAATSGLDKPGMDAGVRPQDSLFGAMNGTWLKNTPIPGDKSDYGTFMQLDDLSNERVKAIIEGLAAKPQAAGTLNAKIGDFYTSYMDTAAIDAAGMRPLWPYMAQLDAVKTKADLVRLMGAWAAFVDLPMGLGVGPDAKDPTIYSAGAGQGGLGIGDRDYYLKKDERFAKARTAYVEYMRQLLAAQGSKNAKVQAAAVMNLETRLAKIQWTTGAEPRSGEDLQPDDARRSSTAKAPAIDWKAYLAAGELADPPFVSIAQPSYFWALSKLVKSEPLDVWKAYMRVHLMDAVSLELPADVREARFQFHGVAMNGIKTDRPRWERAVGTLNDVDGRGDRPGLRLRVLPAGLQDAHGRARRQPDEGLLDVDRRPDLDEPGDQGGGACQAVQVRHQDRLPRPLARLHGARRQGRRPAGQHRARRAVRLPPPGRAQQQAGGSHRMGHERRRRSTRTTTAPRTRSCSRPPSCSRRSST